MMYFLCKALKKNYLFLAAIIVLTPIISCSQSDQNMGTDTFTDSRDGQTYRWIRLKDGKKWMAQNLNYDIEGSTCYEKEKANCDKDGRLYTQKAAIAACPKGWRLPSDDEWWGLALTK